MFFESRARGKYFINNVFKLDSQRSAVLVANFRAVIKVVLLSVVVRCSPLNTALGLVGRITDNYYETRTKNE